MKNLKTILVLFIAFFVVTFSGLVLADEVEDEVEILLVEDEVEEEGELKRRVEDRKLRGLKPVRSDLVAEYRGEINEKKKELREASFEERRELVKKRKEVIKEGQEKRDELRKEVRKDNEEFREKLETAESEEEREEIISEYEIQKAETRNERKKKDEEYRKKMKNFNSEGQRKEIRDKYLAGKEELRDRIEQERKGISVRAAENLEKRLKFTIAKMDLYLKKMESLNERVEERIEIMEDRGVDVSGVRELMSENKKNIEVYESVVEKIKTEADIMDFEDVGGLREFLNNIKEDISGSKKHVKTFSKNIREIVKILKNTSDN